MLHFSVRYALCQFIKQFHQRWISLRSVNQQFILSCDITFTPLHTARVTLSTNSMKDVCMNVYSRENINHQKYTKTLAYILIFRLYTTFVPRFSGGALQSWCPWLSSSTRWSLSTIFARFSLWSTFASESFRSFWAFKYNLSLQRIFCHDDLNVIRVIILALGPTGKRKPKILKIKI